MAKVIQFHRRPMTIGEVLLAIRAAGDHASFEKIDAMITLFAGRAEMSRDDVLRIEADEFNRLLTELTALMLPGANALVSAARIRAMFSDAAKDPSDDE